MHLKRRLSKVERRLTSSKEVQIFVPLKGEVSDEERIANAWEDHLVNGGNSEDRPLYFVEIDPTRGVDEH